MVLLLPSWQLKIKKFLEQELRAKDITQPKTHAGIILKLIMDMELGQGLKTQRAEAITSKINTRGCHTNQRIQMEQHLL